MAERTSKAARTPRAIWRGTISFGMVSIPVNLYTATESHDVRFHLLHRRDGVRLKNVRWCPKDERAVPWDDVVRGFEYTKGKYLPVSEEDLDHLPVKSVHTVDISDFVKLEEVDPIYYDKAYYLAPDEAGVKAFALLRQALQQTGRAAVAKVAIRDKENLCLVRPYEDVLSMETMFYANEIRSAQDIAANGAKVSPKELQMAVSLIENLSDSFDPEREGDLGHRRSHQGQGRRRSTPRGADGKGREGGRLDGGAPGERRADQEERRRNPTQSIERRSAHGTKAAEDGVGSRLTG